MAFDPLIMVLWSIVVVSELENMPAVLPAIRLFLIVLSVDVVPVMWIPYDVNFMVFAASVFVAELYSLTP